jgi:tetratricopeptide (TPR) repeat protein
LWLGPEVVARLPQAGFKSNPRNHFNTQRPGPGARTFRLRASAYREKAQYDLAIQDCDQAIKFDPDDAAVAYYVRGLSKQKKGDKSGGKADIAKAKQLDPKVDQQ